MKNRHPPPHQQTMFDSERPATPRDCGGIGDVVYILYKLVYAGFSNGQILAE